MGSIKNIVNVNITRQTTVPSRAGFGTGAFVSEDATIATDTQSFADHAEVVAATATVGADSVAFSAIYFGQALSPTKLTIIKFTTDITTSLTAAATEDNDWYAFAIYSRVEADILLAAAWAQANGATNPKLYFAQTSDAAVITAVDTDIASQLTALSSFRTSIWWHDTDTEWLEAGVMGGQLPTDAGSITWAYKTVSGVAAYAYTSAEKAFAHGKNCNTYDTVAQVSITEEGKVCDTASGEWIDVIRGIDWQTTEITLDNFSVLINNPKIPYTDPGVGVFYAKTQAALGRGQAQGILSSEVNPVVTVPKVINVPDADKATRTLNNLKFTGTLSGAIQKINIAGTVTL